MFKRLVLLYALLKARYFIKKHNYSALFFTLLKFKNLENLYFNGLTLVQFAIKNAENNALKVFLRQKLKILKHEEDIFENKIKQFIFNIQSKNLSLEPENIHNFCYQRVKCKFLKNYKKEKINFHNANSIDLASFYGNIFALELFKKTLSKSSFEANSTNAAFYALQNDEFFALNWLFINFNHSFKTLEKRLESNTLDIEKMAILALLFDETKDFNALLKQNLLSLNDKYGNHFVHLSTAFNKPKFLNALLRADKSLLELRNAENKGLLKIAVEFGSAKCFMLLVNDYAQDFSAQFFNAVCSGNEEILNFYKTHYKPSDNELSMLYYMWFELGDKDFLQRLADFNLECRDAQGDTPLLNAVKFALFDRVKALIDVGANINALDKMGKNALFYVKEQNNQKLIALLSKSLKNTISQDFEEY